MYKTLLLVTAIALSPLSALAAVQTIPLSDATRGIAPTVNVCPGIGYNLSFLEIPDYVAWAKIDDPSRVHVSFETGDPTKSPAKLIHLQRIEELNFKGLPKAKSTLLSVFTTSKQLLRFKISYTCPNRFNTGVIEGTIAQRPRIRRQPRLTPRSATPGQKQKDPVVPKPKARVSFLPDNSPRLRFADQLAIDKSVTSFYGLPHLPESEVIEEMPVEEEVGEVPPPPVERKFAHRDELIRAEVSTEIPVQAPKVAPRPASKPQAVAVKTDEVSPSRMAWYLTRGLQSAKLQGHINRGTWKYRVWNSIISRVRQGQKLEYAIQGSVPKRELADFQRVGANLLKMGGLH